MSAPAECGRASELTAFLQGETAPEEAEGLRLHLEGCLPCGRERARLEKVRAALLGVERVEPSADFTARVRRSLLRAHPEFLATPPPGKRWWRAFRPSPLVALSLAANAALALVAVWLFYFRAEPGEGAHEATLRWARGRAEPGSGREPGSPSELKGAALPGDANRVKLDHEAWQGRMGRDRHRLKFIEDRKPGGDKAVAAALEWLARAQRPDGGWAGASPQAGQASSPHLTGLSLLAFLGEGHTPAGGPHAGAVRRGLDFLLGEQRASGLVGTEPEGAMMGHAIAGMALLEAAILMRDERLAAAAAAAVSFTVSAQNRTGGWGRSWRGEDHDPFVVGWQVTFLRLAQVGGHAGVICPLLQADRRLRMAGGHEADAGGRASGSGGLRAVTAVGMLAHQMASPAWDTRLLWSRAETLLELSPIPGMEKASFGQNDLDFAYFGTLALHQLGGEGWTRWWHPLREKVLLLQARDGSWPADLDPWRAEGGQVHTTALAALILETPGRYPRMAE